MTITFSKLALASCVLLSGVESFLVPPSCSTHQATTSLQAIKEEDSHSSRRKFLLIAPTAAAFIPLQNALAVEEDNINNEFIQQLKARSDANREQYNRQARSAANKLDSSTFASQYKRPKFIGIRKMDGSSYQMVEARVLDDLMAQGLVIAEYDDKVNKDGVVSPDYAKGVVYQFKDANAQAKAEKSVSRASSSASSASASASASPTPEPTPEPVEVTSGE